MSHTARSDGRPLRPLESHRLARDRRRAARVPAQRGGRRVRRGAGNPLQGLDLRREQRTLGSRLPLRVAGSGRAAAAVARPRADRQGSGHRRDLRSRGVRLRFRPARPARARLWMSSLRSERDGDVLRIAMARPARRNAFDASLIDELTAAFADGGDGRCVVLSGDGPSFSAGADVEWMRSSVELTYDENLADALRLRAMLDAIDSCPAPVVARVQGHALGGGCGLVACSDVVVAEPGAQFAFSEVKLGIVPAVISPFALAKIGPSAARRYFVTGERFTAEVAFRIGLISEVADDLDTAVDNVVSELLSAGPHATRTAKRLASHAHTADETAKLIAEHR